MISNFKYRPKLVIFLFLLVMHGFVFFVTSNSEWVEKHYSAMFYQSYAERLRKISGIFDFSVGDFLYGLISLFFIYWVFKKIYQRITNRQQPIHFWKMLMNIVLVALSISLLFQIVWGINYHRKGIAWQLGLDAKKYDIVALNKLTDQLILKTNCYKQWVPDSSTDKKKSKTIFSAANASFEAASKRYPFLRYKNSSIKASEFPGLMSVSGISGYYNPFSGEAQVNTKVPGFLLPYITCHEMAHQLGYAKENEANFVAYLVAQQSTDAQLKYAAYLEMFLYANKNLYLMDSCLAKEKIQLLSAPVKKDIQTIIRYNQSNINLFEPLVTKIYDWFLKGNQQPKGMMSYDEVLQLIIAYHHKNEMK